MPAPILPVPIPPTGLRPALEVKFAAADLSGVDGEGVFSGYASLFGSADLSGDIVMPGAFARSIRARGVNGIRMLYQHDPAAPIGVWLALVEDRRGLFVRGCIMADVARGREALALMRAGALDGLSIGFKTVKARADRKAGTRQLSEIDLWEVSVVTFPMQPEARIAAVKSSTLRLAARMRRAALTLNQRTSR
ncbi:HK97 family phage prohead protease [Kaistia dalseonensis]|uniref:HK97 family phage prohead protease n=1 Tax=Kaistia dalseonensis TaxID=410840 RepID=A0ABU0HD97_9HYPH|nr:HK97 family phage prohead protease [Kaistia dalseonensis]MCX5497655.1 HK97 family phage prohead protease [Kaistia dalseonensis]MDQ0440299.1 HK97 family phage prohead protease [Kaistia dalseonensis]